MVVSLSTTADLSTQLTSCSFPLGVRRDNRQSMHRATPFSDQMEKRDVRAAYPTGI